jgi:hypothetical protein
MPEFPEIPDATASDAERAAWSRSMDQATHRLNLSARRWSLAALATSAVAMTVNVAGLGAHWHEAGGWTRFALFLFIASLGALFCFGAGFVVGICRQRQRCR